MCLHCCRPTSPMALYAHALAWFFCCFFLFVFSAQERYVTLPIKLITASTSPHLKQALIDPMLNHNIAIDKCLATFDQSTS